MELRSPAFDDGALIDPRHTCDDVDVSPPLELFGLPEGTASLALVVDSPEVPGGVFTHWLLWNLPADTTEIPAGYPPAGEAEAIEPARQGINDFGHQEYGGPCPPKGNEHTYRFQLFALDTHLSLEEGATRDELDAAIDGHVLDACTLEAIYRREGKTPKVLESEEPEQQT